MTSPARGPEAVHSVPAQPGVQQAPARHAPTPPEAAWSMAACRRRTWVSRAVLLCVLACQAALSLRLENTAFQEEAAYLSSGHAQIARLLHGNLVPADLGSHLSAARLLYPVPAALADAALGLAGARLLSLCFMLGATAVLYALTRRLFSERPALAAAALFAVLPSTIVLGHSATHDSAAVFLLALAAWIIVRTARAPLAVMLLAAPVALLAIGARPAAGLCLPGLAGLAALVTWQQGGRVSLARAGLLVIAVAAPALVWLHLADVLGGLRAVVSPPGQGTRSTSELLRSAALWSGPLLLTACGGAVAYAFRGRMNESPSAARLGVPGAVRRAVLGLLLCGTALLVLAWQLRLTSAARPTGPGLGLLFAAPMAGVGLTRLGGAHFRHAQLACALWVAALCVGTTGATAWFTSWPEASRLTTTLRQYVTPGAGHYLASTPSIPAYYLRDITDRTRWTSLGHVRYRDARGTLHHGADGYRRALADGWFDLVVLDGAAAPRMDPVVAAAVRDSGRYRLLGAARSSENDGRYRIWVRR
ncbi:glycosyltransferase family 39 protein [Streptomyces sp. NPDC020362]|uniref:glycosyltransferase family 39 protein n=1 Tax=unclassified Streptomyces TaxID=2593676 RepID=UPI0034039AD9